MPEFELPEFTRSLRALAVPSAPGSDHDGVFRPLIQARTAAHKVQAPEAKIAAFDAARLEREWREAITTFATVRHAKSAPDRRALEAELSELAAPLWAALGRMQVAASGVRSTNGPARHTAWDLWVASVQQVFDAADDWWRAAVPVLADSRGRQGALWRRIIGKGS